MLAAVLLLQIAGATAAPARSAGTDDTVSAPRITLDEALRRAARYDPEYAAASGEVGSAVWARRAARSAIWLPSLSVQSDASKYSTPTFNLGTGSLQDVSVSAQVNARYDLFAGGRKFAELRRAGAELARAEAAEVEARYDVGVRTQRDYYQALAGEELVRVARERVRRAEEQLVVARARVVSGAAVSTDSLQLRLELSEARVALLEQDAALRVARLQLGRRVGLDGAARPAPVDSLPPAELPLSLDRTVAEARERGPAFIAARAQEDAAEALVRAQRGGYFPQLSLSAASMAFDNRYFPDATTRSAVTFSVVLPVWNNGQREVALQQARALRDVARVRRADRERAAERDLTEAYALYGTTPSTVQLRREALVVARENYRVQDARYRAGATTILDLLSAQEQLADAEAGLVQATVTAHLALAELEAILGRRLFTDRTTP